MGVALNARDAGLSLQPTAGASADLRVVRIPLAAAEPWIALANVAAAIGLPSPKNNGGSAEDLYSAEQGLLGTKRLIPLFPLQLVVFPRIHLALHIFEDRYKEMVGEAIRDGSEFGIGNS